MHSGATHGWLSQVRSPPHPDPLLVGARATARRPGRGLMARRRRSPSLSPRRGEGARRADEGVPHQPWPHAQPDRAPLRRHATRTATRRIRYRRRTARRGPPGRSRSRGCTICAREQPPIEPADEGRHREEARRRHAQHVADEEADSQDDALEQRIQINGFKSRRSDTGPAGPAGPSSSPAALCRFRGRSGPSRGSSWRAASTPRPR